MAKTLTVRGVERDAQPVRLTAVPSGYRPPAILDTRVQFADEIGRLWREAERGFVEIGRRLNEAKARLDHGEFMAMVASDLPFAHRTATRLMTVARELDAGALPVERLPPNWGTVYEVLTLEPDERQAALEAGVIHPAMKRADVARFKREIRPAEPVDALAEIDAAIARLEERLAALHVKRATLVGD